MIFAKDSDTEFLSHKLSYEIIKMFDDGEYNLVFSTTWTDESDLKVIEDYQKLYPGSRVAIISSFDQSLHENYYQTNVNHYGCENFCFWLLATDKYFLNYTPEEVKPTTFENNFLCYQRKVYDERELMYQILKYRKGIVTLSGEDFKDINNNLPAHTGYNEVGFGEREKGRIPNDIWSLGNIDIWNKSFLNIVVETTQDLVNKNYFLSEKTFKPIIGMRPFLIYGHPRSTAALKEMGFETFDDDFGYVPTNSHIKNAIQIGKIVDDLGDLDSFYQKLLPKIEHNKNTFKANAEREWNKLKTLVNDYKRARTMAPMA